MSRIYLDHAATTPMRPEVLAAMEPYFTNAFGNPSSIHAYGQEAKAALDNARDTLAEALGAEPSEITFTGGGTEADNLAVVGVMLANEKRGNHFITSTIEHEAVTETMPLLGRIGCTSTVLSVDHDGMVRMDDLRAALTEKTVLVSIMHANNEVGTIEPISELAAIAHERGALFHTDAVQTFGLLPVNVDELGVDLLTVSSHKIYGPKGVGALYVRRGTPIEAVTRGGGQERTRRSGTENIAGIVGFAEATRLMLQGREHEAQRETELRDWFISSALAAIPEASLNGHPTQRLPNNINLSIAGVEGEALLLNLDIAGIAASAGSACASGSIEPSHVLVALGIADDRVRGAVRFSLGRSTKQDDLERVLDVLVTTVKRLRQMTGQTLPASRNGRSQNL